MQFPIYIASLLYVVLLIFIRDCVSPVYDVDVKAIISSERHSWYPIIFPITHLIRFMDGKTI